MNALWYGVYMAAGYVSGSVLYAYLLPRLLRHIDITTQSDDGNPGTANAFLYAGIPVGILVVIAEVAKGFVPVWLAARVLDTRRLWFALVLAAPVVGHAFPFWRIRGGGKAIAVSFGALLGLWPQYRPVAILAGLYLFYSLIVRIRPHSYRSIVTFFCFGVLSFLLVDSAAVVIGSLLIAAVVIYQHLRWIRGDTFGVEVWPLHKLRQSAKQPPRD